MRCHLLPTYHDALGMPNEPTMLHPNTPGMPGRTARIAAYALVCGLGGMSEWYLMGVYLYCNIGVILDAPMRLPEAVPPLS